MKHRTLFLGGVVIFLTLIPLVAIAQEKYVPKADEELYGIWNDGTISTAYEVYSAGEYKDYFHGIDEVMREATFQIDSKWTDSEGNIWYKVFGAVTDSGQKFQVLFKISRKGTQLEKQLKLVLDFDQSNYPVKLDPADAYYHIYTREVSPQGPKNLIIKQ